MTVPNSAWHSRTAKPKRRRLASAKDVAEYLGIPLTSLYDRTRAGAIPGVVRIGRRILYDLDKIEPWVDAGGDAQEDAA